MIDTCSLEQRHQMDRAETLLRQRHGLPVLHDHIGRKTGTRRELEQFHAENHGIEYVVAPLGLGT